MKAFRSLLILLVVAAAGILGAQWLGQQPIRDMGEVVVRAGGNDYIATLPQAALALLIAVIVLWLLWSLISAPFHAWRRYRRKQGRARLIDGLEALDRGQWSRAEKLLKSAASETQARPIAQVAALRAAEARGDNATAGQYLQELADSDITLHALHSAERWLEQQRPEEAITALDVAAAQPLPPRGLWLRSQALSAAGRAEDAYGQLGAMRLQQALPADALAALETQLAAQMLSESSDVNALAAHWDVLSKAQRAEPRIVSAYVQRAIALGWGDTAIRTLELTLDSHWDESLAALYGRIAVEKFDTRRASAQRWLQAHPNSPALLITLASLARQQGQWEQAEAFLHRAIAQGGGAEAWEALGDGFAAHGEDALARHCLQNALRCSRDEAAIELERRDLRQRIQDQAVAEERDEHGLPRLPQ